jgi:uncharacterized SAM-dependent methyltransferase
MVVGWAMNAIQDATLIELGHGDSQKQSRRLLCTRVDKKKKEARIGKD